MSGAQSKLVWVDLEMTGLDPASCVILEIATIVTSPDLAEVTEGPSITIGQPESVLLAMDPVVQEMHQRSGLWQRVLEAKATLAEAEAESLAFVAAHVEKGVAPLCGNSVWKDKVFLEKYMPAFVGHLHYRIVDVSTLKELVRRWYPASFHAPKKKEVHRALDDIRESIEELRWYKNKVLVAPS